MKPEEFVESRVINGQLVNIGMDDYGQQFFFEYVKDGELKSIGCGAYNTDYMGFIDLWLNRLDKMAEDDWLNLLEKLIDAKEDKNEEVH